MAKVLVGCEKSGIVREAFRALGHDAWSCDLEAADDGSKYHIIADVRDIIHDWNWDLGIFHPPCTYLAVSGLHWNKRRPEREQLTKEAAIFFLTCYEAPIPHVAVENPIGHMNSAFCKPDQIIQPWQFGHPESKATCLWLRGLPKLEPTAILAKPERGYWDNQTPSGQNKLGPSANRAEIRSRTYPGIALAMAAQWDKLLT